MAEQRKQETRRAQRLGEFSVLEWEQRLRDELVTGGLWIPDTQAPDYRTLRPYGPVTTPGFPIYENLEERLAETKEHPDEVVAHVLATCAAYSYSDTATVSMIMARLGLEQNVCRTFTSFVDPMFIRSTAFLIQSRSGRVAILCYRGTELTSFVNWLTDADVAVTRMEYGLGDRGANVHAGFYRNVRATRYQVVQALKQAQESRSVRVPLPCETNGTAPSRTERRLEALYITGHSLGAAMAAMMTVMLKHERKFAVGEDELASLLRATYTFGQPMIGDPAFAKGCEENEFLRTKVLRFIYDNDVVPHLPPRSTGPFQHFGREYRYHIPNLQNSICELLGYLGCAQGGQNGTWREEKKPTGQSLTAFGGFGLAGASFLLKKIKPLRSLPFPYSFDDHSPINYVQALTPPGVQNEFGD